jgi:hypothetical protein
MEDGEFTLTYVRRSRVVEKKYLSSPDPVCQTLVYNPVEVILG